jgi:hypothetical protein
MGIISRNVFKEFIGNNILSGMDFELLSLGDAFDAAPHNF